MKLEFNQDYINRSYAKVAMVVTSNVVGDSRVLKTAQTARKMGYQVTLYGLHSDEAYTPKKIYGHPFEVILFPAPKAEERRRLKRVAREKQLIERFVQSLEKEFAKNPPDILHTHDMRGIAIGGALCQSKDKKYTFKWIHDIHEYVDGLTILHKDTQKFYQKVEQDFIKKPDELLSPSPALNSILAKKYKLPKKPNLVLNTPRITDFDKHKEDLRSNLKLPSDALLIVYSGTVKPARGLDVAVEALSLLPDAHLAIVSTPSTHLEALQEKAKELGVADRLHFHPYVPVEAVSSFLHSADIGIFPVQNYLNADIALPTKLFEYLHAGLPVVSSNTRAMQEFIKHYECGFSFEFGNVEDFVLAINRAAERLGSDKKWRKSIQALSKTYCWEEQEKVLEKVYSEFDKKLEPVNTASALANMKILQLPTNNAGQPHTFATTMRHAGANAASLSVGNNAFEYQTDQHFKSLPEDQGELTSFASDLADKYNTFHFHSRPFFYSSDSRFPTGLDLLFLRGAGKKVFFHFRGSEARQESVFKEKSPYNYVKENPDLLFYKFNEQSQRTFIDYALGVCNKVFAVDPEIQTYVPNSVVVPRALDLRKWQYVGVGAKAGKPLKIVHAPSRPTVKGTPNVLEAIDRLKSEGFDIDFKLIKGMPHAEAMKLYKQADIVIDQLRIGWYGVLAVEAMALGKVVISYVRDDLKHHLPHPMPLILANPDNIYDKLKAAAQNPEGLEALGKRARKYTEEMHDADKISAMLLKIYAETPRDNLDFHKLMNMFIYQQKPPKRLNKMATARFYSGLLRKNMLHKFFIEDIKKNGLGSAVKKAYKYVFK